MPPLDRIESRSLSTGLAQRTIKNLEFIRQAHDRNEDVHIVMQLVNSLLGLLVFPVAKEKTFFNSFRRVRLADPPEFSEVCRKLPAFPLLPSLTVAQFGNCPNLGRFFRRLRNAIAHRRLVFSDDSHDLSAVIITLGDAPNDTEPIDWEISLSAEDLGRLCLYIANEVIKRHL